LRAAAPRLRYALAGPWIEPDLQPPIERWLAARAWADYVGAVAPADAQALQQQADVTLHSGRREGTANALLEALALGTPALVLATEVTRELLRHEQEAWLFTAPAGAVAGLRRILGEPAFARELAAAGRRAVHERHDPAREAAGYIRTWHLALGR
jgi:phosphatidylinositol alpha 1,6-mannosyltransferase